jgi:hypothetical protein
VDNFYPTVVEVTRHLTALVICYHDLISLKKFCNSFWQRIDFHLDDVQGSNKATGTKGILILAILESKELDRDDMDGELVDMRTQDTLPRSRMPFHSLVGCFDVIVNNFSV